MVLIACRRYLDVTKMYKKRQKNSVSIEENIFYYTGTCYNVWSKFFYLNLKIVSYNSMAIAIQIIFIAKMTSLQNKLSK